MLKKYWKSLLLTVGVLLIGFCFLNFPYLGFQLNALVNGTTKIYSFSKQTSPQKIVVPNRLTILNLNIKAPIIYITEKNDAVYEDALQKGVVHFPGTALPGELGNCYIFGHSSDYIWKTGKYKTVFAPLPGIVAGDTITISNAAGQEFNYVVYKTFVTGPDDTSVLDQGDHTKKLLTLQTSYPLGTALKRFIVQAELKD